MRHTGTDIRFVRSGTVDLAVRQVGVAGPFVVLVHGLGDTQRSWDRVVRHLASTFRLITYDLRGHGRSSAGDRCDIDALLADLAAVVSSVAVDRPLLVGHSLGGLLVMEYAAAHLCRGVVGVEGGLGVERPQIAWGDLAARMARAPNRLRSRLLAAPRLGSRLSLADIRRLTEDAEAHERRLEDLYRRVRCPMLSCWAVRPTRCLMAKRCGRQSGPRQTAFGSAIRRSRSPGSIPVIWFRSSDRESSPN